MAGDTSIRDDLLSRLAHQPQYIMTGMIKISNPATPSTITRNPNPTAELGQLDKLPLELLHFTFSMLDLKSISKVSRTCLRGLALVESMLEYRDLIRHAPSTMTALGLTELIEYHSAYNIHRSLLASKCASCGEFGAFLFLLTCERCCYDCLCHDQRFRAITPFHASNCFELSAASLKKLPSMRSLKGTYDVRQRRSWGERVPLVSARAAKKLALDEGKSMQVLAGELERRRQEGREEDWYVDTVTWLQAASLEPNDVTIEVETRRPANSTPVDDFGGMASIPFPSLRSTTSAERGLWCLGCEKTYQEWTPGELDFDASRLVDHSNHHDGLVHHTTQTARSEDGFFEHIVQCSGAKEMVPDLEDKLRQMAIA